MLVHILQDALFAAIAAIGFAAISRPPRRAYIYCALIAAVGHGLRYVLMDSGTAMHIVPATFVAAFVIGVLAVFAASHAKFPAETCLFPALLPMIPGIYAYKAFGGLASGILSTSADAYNRYMYLFSYNGTMCCCILLAMVTGASLPIFILRRWAFQATR